MVGWHRLVPVKKTFQHQPSRVHHDLEVQPESNIANVVRIPLIAAEDAFEARGGTTVSSDLGQTGNPRPGHIAKTIVGYKIGELLRVLQHVWPGPHNTHLSQQNVNELWNLIETGIAEKPSDPGDPGIIRTSPAGIGRIVNIHGSELV